MDIDDVKKKKKKKKKRKGNYTITMDKMGKCPFKKKKKKNPAFCPISQTNQGNFILLKLDFLKIELLKKKKKS